ncbi:hypothetical protein cand_007610 [Cryptosporidium andersoni]|uniref:Uncharacterized protein n=1 Tax=Cryptosporidium andersoni TaxID=117008 RepID=A0A1J4MPN5_9CRYT|nr:hypothetical protein cand_007610 [Cryptosporidium andersoni]
MNSYAAKKSCVDGSFQQVEYSGGFEERYINRIVVRHNTELLPRTARIDSLIPKEYSGVKVSDKKVSLDPEQRHNIRHLLVESDTHDIQLSPTDSISSTRNLSPKSPPGSEDFLIFLSEEQLLQTIQPSSS